MGDDAIQQFTQVASLVLMSQGMDPQDPGDWFTDAGLPAPMGLRLMEAAIAADRLPPIDDITDAEPPAGWLDAWMQAMRQLAGKHQDLLVFCNVTCDESGPVNGAVWTVGGPYREGMTLPDGHFINEWTGRWMLPVTATWKDS